MHLKITAFFFKKSTQGTHIHTGKSHFPSTSYLRITQNGNSTVSIYMHKAGPWRKLVLEINTITQCKWSHPLSGRRAIEGEGGNNRKREMEVRWKDRGGFQSQQWLTEIFLPRTVSTHLSYIKAWQMPSRGERGQIKHGSLCLRVRWKTLNNMTGWSQPWDGLRVCWGQTPVRLRQTAGDTRRRPSRAGTGSHTQGE